MRNMFIAGQGLVQSWTIVNSAGGERKGEGCVCIAVLRFSQALYSCTYTSEMLKYTQVKYFTLQFTGKYCNLISFLKACSIG